MYSLGGAAENIFEPSAGTTVSATISEANSANEMVSANGAISWRTVPVVKTKGKNTHTEVMVEATMAPVTCTAPCAAARVADSPRARMR